jgi:hypothetical protein
MRPRVRIEIGILNNNPMHVINDSGAGSIEKCPLGLRISIG